MGTAKMTWDGTWTQDGTVGPTINDNAEDDSIELTNHDGLVTEIAISITYGSPYDEPCIAYPLRRLSGAGTYEDPANASGEPIEGAVSATGTSTFSVGPDVNAFIIRIRNDSGAQVTGVTLHYKQGHILTAA